MIAALLLAAFLGVPYAAAARRSKRWPAARTAAFAAGLALLVWTEAGPLHSGGERELRLHMTQHLVTVLVVAPLLAAGSPLALAVRALHGPARRRLLALLQSRAARTLGRPAVGWALLTLTLVLSHVPAFYDLALRVPAVHAAEHAALFWTALLFWTPLLGAAPLPGRPGPFARLGWCLAAMPAMSAVAAWLADGQAPRYATYAHTLGARALGDQRDAAAIMASTGTIPLALVGVSLAIAGMLEQERRQKAREAISAEAGMAVEAPR
jgi:putative membrane protein